MRGNAARPLELGWPAGLDHLSITPAARPDIQFFAFFRRFRVEQRRRSEFQLVGDRPTEHAAARSFDGAIQRCRLGHCAAGCAEVTMRSALSLRQQAAALRDPHEHSGTRPHSLTPKPQLFSTFLCVITCVNHRKRCILNARRAHSTAASRRTSWGT